jgi:hypothetical protein
VSAGSFARGNPLVSEMKKRASPTAGGLNSYNNLNKKQRYKEGKPKSLTTKQLSETSWVPFFLHGEGKDGSWPSICPLGTC